MVGLTLPPWMVARAVDQLTVGDRAAVVEWSVALLAVSTLLAVVAIWRHRTMTKVRMDAAFRTLTALVDKAMSLGASLTQRARSGDVAAIGISDVWALGRTLTLTGPGVGAVAAYVVIAVLLFQISVVLAIVVLAGVPLMVLLLGPALQRMQRTTTSYRAQDAVASGRIVDIIGGLGVLNGIGGKAVHADRYRRESQELQQRGYALGRVASWIQAVGAGLPALFLAVVVWLAARLAVTSQISVGDVVAIFGYVAVLVVPVSQLMEGAVDVTRALVAGRRVTAFLALERTVPDGTAQPPDGAGLVDDITGLDVPYGRFTAVAVTRQTDAVDLIDRLGGFRPGATWGGRPVSSVEPVLLRQRLLVADNDADVFTGSLADVVAGARNGDRAAVTEALRTAAAEDLVRGLPDGLESRIEPGGRNLSGGQRQRLRLARAVAADPEVLLAVDPTSAVDAVTEAEMITRLVRARHGRTTVVASTSATVLAAADRVHLIDGDRLVASGRHASLVRDVPAYAALVLRGEAST